MNEFYCYTLIFLAFLEANSSMTMSKFSVSTRSRSVESTARSVTLVWLIVHSTSQGRGTCSLRDKCCPHGYLIWPASEFFLPKWRNIASKRNSNISRWLHTGQTADIFEGTKWLEFVGYLTTRFWRFYNVFENFGAWTIAGLLAVVAGLNGQ